MVETSDVGIRDVISCDRAGRGENPDRAEETRSQGDTAGVEDQGGADGSWDRGGGLDLEYRCGAAATEV